MLFESSNACTARTLAECIAALLARRRHAPRPGPRSERLQCQGAGSRTARQAESTTATSKGSDSTDGRTRS
jgi:hypothetical protein